MTLVDEVYTHARILAPELSQECLAMLEAVCRSAAVSLKSQLRDNVTVEDCKADFVTAASMLALAALSEVGDLGQMGQLEQISAGDLTLRKGKNNMASECLRSQAQILMMGYIKGPFLFVGV